MRGKKIQIKLSAPLLQAVDEAARQDLTTRSAFIRQCIVMRLNGQRITERPRAGDLLEALRRSGSNGSG